MKLSLAREDKNFAAQYPQRTSILLGLRPPYFQNFFRVFHLAILLTRKWCKGKVFFLIYQIFSKLFSKNFSKDLFDHSAILLTRKWCKGKAFFLIYQIFGELFSKNFFQRPFLFAFRSVSFSNAGAK